VDTGAAFEVFNHDAGPENPTSAYLKRWKPY
jgi:hypothetical protein